jgi:hypothetical protein
MRVENEIEGNEESFEKCGGERKAEGNEMRSR